MGRVRIGVIGAGLVAQVEHVPNLLRLKDRFEIQGVCDPSAVARGFMAERYGLATFSTLEDLLALPLDAVVIASPDPLHHEHVLAAFAHGLHVFCEKPLCYALRNIEAAIIARNASGRILQVGYMKRFDPSYEAALVSLPGTAATLRHISVEVSDPDAWPFIRHHDSCRGGDVRADLIAAVNIKQREQVALAVPAPLDEAAYRGFCNAYCSALVHDVNAVHGLLDALGVPDGEIIGASLFAGGDGGYGAIRLLGGRALWSMTHIATPKLPDYRERITLYFDDASLELEFPSPWLNHQPTRLIIRRGDGHRLSTQDIRTGYEEAFVEQLKGFWSAIVDGTPVRNTAEHAARDMTLLCGLAHWHATHSPSPLRQGIAA